MKLNAHRVKKVIVDVKYAGKRTPLHVAFQIILYNHVAFHMFQWSLNPLISRPGCMPGSRYTVSWNLKLELLTQFPASNDEKYINVVYI